MRQAFRVHLDTYYRSKRCDCEFYSLVPSKRKSRSVCVVDKHNAYTYDPSGKANERGLRVSKGKEPARTGIEAKYHRGSGSLTSTVRCYISISVA